MRSAALAARPLAAGPHKQRVVLGTLLCRANQVVSVDALSEALWGDAPPRTAGKNIQVLISMLRKGLGGRPEDPARDADSEITLTHRHAGYVIEIGPRQLDALEFQEHVQAGRVAERAGDVAGAARALGTAVSLWRGPMLPELATVPIIATQARRLREQYLDAYESWAEAELALGHHAALLDGLNELARRHPFRERLRSAQMLALYRSGRRAEALAQYETMRQLLARELGLAPSPVLARLYASLIAGEAAAAEQPAALEPPRERAALVREEPQAPAERARVRLPRELTDFTGRRSATAALLEVLGDGGGNRVAVLSGPAGVGKSALAVHCAHRLADQYPHARVMARLRGPDGTALSISEVLGDLLHALVPDAEAPRGLDDRAGALRERTAQRRMLFVLDDAVTEVQVRHVLWAIGDSAALITSRRRLTGLEGATQHALGPLREPEAVELLGRLIGPARLAADPDSARRIAAACGGLPLAVRIAGAKLAGLRHLPLARFAERLADDGRLLEELTAGDLRIRPALALAHQDLSPGDQAVLASLAGAPGVCFTGGEAAALLGTALPQAESAIERLIEAHLVEALPMPDLGPATAVPDDLSELDGLGRFGGGSGSGFGGSGGPFSLSALSELSEEEDDVFAQTAEPLYRLLPLIRVFVREGYAR
ncbi:winged helix-turn-helix domain-containing protein [Actinospica durhamensis]|uniref:Winged helix-turn-helix domain-containing protein n=1 Tax=Actinospica durhamensis TaxID=1508375 RepID=A0A941IW03_9ACTN|nr:AfsR/SARP family transcriptional regulator [Actinospica durhamensis]MBR7838136.1 winged helix-turn-helix domain-containing protein [Actinospica durhamensis]